ncbi:MAG: AAA family ATPase [Acetatifactor sp.]
MQTGKMRPEIETVVQNMERAIVGKREVIVLVLTALLAEGHVLMEDVPGVGKTKLAASLAASCRGTFSRIQMTPDVMPSDITGFHMLQGLDGKREFKRGAAFCNILLADEINRASAKSQSALLEIMEENQISIDGITYQLEKPFMVIATQNPVETYGTYHLPEAQMDRFMFKLSIGYPGRENELDILRRQYQLRADELQAVIGCEQINDLIREVKQVTCAPCLEEYIVDIVEATRSLPGVRLGVSPRGSIALYRSAQAYAYLQGRDYILPDDIKYLAPFCLGHRLLLLPGNTRSGDSVIEQVLEQVPVPVK